MIIMNGIVFRLQYMYRVDSFPPIGGFPPIFHGFWPPWDQYKSGEKVGQYVGGYAFYKHPKLLKNGQKQLFSAPEIHCQNPPWCSLKT